MGAAKWLLAIGLIAYLLESDRLAFSDLKPLIASPFATLSVLCGMFLLLVTGFWRWKVLVQRLGVRMTFFDALRLGMVGAFFSAVLPGTVSGDLVKAIYVARRYPGRRTLTVSSVLLDRMMGLLALVSVGAGGYLLGQDRIEALAGPSRSLLTSLGSLLVVAAGVTLVSLGLMPMMQQWLRRRLPAWIVRRRAGRVLDDILRIYGERPQLLWFVYGLSLIVHVANLGLLFGVSRILFERGAQVPFSVFVMASAMGICAMALPIAPLGLGVGQLAFASMFHALGVPMDTFGASLITAFQALSLILNLFGGIFYLTYRNDVVLSEVERSLTTEEMMV